MTTRTKLADLCVNTKIPWKQIALCKGIWACFVVLFCHGWTTSILFSFLPLYMATVLNFDLSKNGLLSSLPYVTSSLSTFIWSYVSGKLTKVMTVTNTRKLIQAGGFFVAAAVTVGLCYINEGQEYIAVAIFTIAGPFTIVTVNSGIITPMDMAPQFASMITSVALALFLLGGMVSPLVTSYILTERSRQQWSTVFYMKAGVYVLAAIVFLTLGSGELQPWATNSQQVFVDVEGKQSRSKSQDNIGYIADVDETTHM